MTTKDRRNLQRCIATALADEMEATLKHSWGDLVAEAVSSEAGHLSDEDRDNLANSITWTLIDENTGDDLLNAEAKP